MGKRNYFIAFVRNEDNFDWCVFETTDYEYAHRIFEGVAIPPEYDKKELRVTDEPIDTYLSYEVLECAPMA